jgi:hypothetical protein
MSDFGFELTGLDAVLRNFGALEAKVRAELPGALYELGEEVIAESDKLVPKDLSALKDSKFVAQPVRAGDDVSVTLGYGGEAKDYAEAVHEHPSEHDPKSWKGITIVWHTPGTGPKYLERPMIELKRTYLSRIAETLRARLGL